MHTDTWTDSLGGMQALGNFVILSWSVDNFQAFSHSQVTEIKIFFSPSSSASCYWAMRISSTTLGLVWEQDYMHKPPHPAGIPKLLNSPDYCPGFTCGLLTLPHQQRMGMKLPGSALPSHASHHVECVSKSCSRL